MFDVMFETFRKASESYLQTPQDMMKHLTQQMFSGPPMAAGVSADWSRTAQKRSMEMMTEALNKHRESIDSMYKSGIQVIEQAFRATEAKSSEDYRKVAEELWHKLLDVFKEQSETQFREFQKWSEKSFEVQKGTA